MQPLETYLQDLAQVRVSGANVKELSFYPALKDLLDAAGKELKPKVQSVLSIKNQGAGMPDGGLFTASNDCHSVCSTGAGMPSNTCANVPSAPNI